MRIGATGHQRLPDTSAWKWVEEEIRGFLASALRPVVGLTSLAIGADQLFARCVLELGGQIHVVVPFPSYETTFLSPDDLKHYRDLLGRAAKTQFLAAAQSPEASYLAAGKAVTDQADVLVAVWDGKPAKGLGGTGDIVAYAAKAHKHVYQIDPLTRTVRRHQ